MVFGKGRRRSVAVQNLQLLASCGARRLEKLGSSFAAEIMAKIWFYMQCNDDFLEKMRLYRGAKKFSARHDLRLPAYKSTSCARLLIGPAGLKYIHFVYISALDDKSILTDRNNRYSQIYGINCK